MITMITMMIHSHWFQTKLYKTSRSIMIILLLLKPTGLVVKPHIAPQALRKGLHGNTRSEELLVVTGERAKRERPAVKSTAKDHVVVDWVDAREVYSLRARIDDGIDVLQHGDQLVVGLGRGEFQVGDKTVHFGEGDDDGDVLGDGVTQTAFGVEHDPFHCVNADNATICYTET